MRLRFVTLLVLLAAALSAPLGSRAGGETPANSYDVIQVGAGGTIGNDLNDAGHVVGDFFVGGNQHAFVWSNGAVTDLGTLGGAWSSATAVNNLDQVVGCAERADGEVHAFFRAPNSGMQDLGTLGGPWSYADGVNDAGQVVGSATDAEGTNRATLWQGGQAYDLGTPAGTHSYAFDINHSGVVVGYYLDLNGEWRAFRWIPIVPNGTTGNLVILQPDSFSVAYAVNGPGEAAGEAYDLDWTSSSTLWNAVETLALPRLPGSFGSTALGINDSRTVVGYEYQDNGLGDSVYRAYAWNPTYGTRHLDHVVNSTGLAPLETAVAVNNSGQIVVNGWGGAVLLTPSGVPHPPTGLGAAAEATRVTLTWSPSSGAEQYVVRRATVSSGPYTTLGSVTGTSFTDTAVNSGATYSYVVSAANTYGESAPSQRVTATIPPAPPTNLTAAAAKRKRRIELKWRQSISPGVIQNRIYRSTSPGGGYTLRATLSATTSYADTSVSSGLTYYYVVTAVANTGRVSAFSNQASATSR